MFRTVVQGDAAGNAVPIANAGGGVGGVPSVVGGGPEEALGALEEGEEGLAVTVGGGEGGGGGCFGVHCLELWLCVIHGLMVII